MKQVNITNDMFLALSRVTECTTDVRHSYRLRVNTMDDSKPIGQRPIEKRELTFERIPIGTLLYIIEYIVNSCELVSDVVFEKFSDVYPWPIRVQIIGSVVDDTTSLFTLEMVG